MRDSRGKSVGLLRLNFCLSVLLLANNSSHFLCDIIHEQHDSLLAIVELLLDLDAVNPSRDFIEKFRRVVF